MLSGGTAGADALGGTGGGTSDVPPTSASGDRISRSSSHERCAAIASGVGARCSDGCGSDSFAKPSFGTVGDGGGCRLPRGGGSGAPRGGGSGGISDVPPRSGTDTSRGVHDISYSVGAPPPRGELGPMLEK